MNFDKILAFFPAKNLNYGMIAAFAVVALELVVKHSLGIDLAAEVAFDFSTPSTPLTAQSVLVSAATGAWYLVAHGSDVKDNLQAQKSS